MCVCVCVCVCVCERERERERVLKIMHENKDQINMPPSLSPSLSPPPLSHPLFVTVSLSYLCVQTYKRVLTDFYRGITIVKVCASNEVKYYQRKLFPFLGERNTQPKSLFETVTCVTICFEHYYIIFLFKECSKIE